MKTYRDHSMMFKGHVCHYTHKLPAMEVSGKAGQPKLQRCVESIIVCDVTVTKCDGLVLLVCFVAQTRVIMFARAGDNVVFVREPSLQPVQSQLHEGWHFADRCVYIVWGI